MTLIDSLSSDSAERDGIIAKWNDEVGKGEVQEIGKWKKKLDRLKKFPDDPSLEQHQQPPRQVVNLTHPGTPNRDQSIPQLQIQL